MRLSLRALMCLAVVAPATAMAQGPRGAAPPAADESEGTRAARREAREKLKKEVLDQMRAMRVWKLTYELKLDQATAAKVFPVLAEFDDRARALGKERGEIARQIHGEVRGEGRGDGRGDGRDDGRGPGRAAGSRADKGKQAAPPLSDEKLRPLIDKLLANQKQRAALDEERFKALRPALTPMQQAKLLLLLPRIDDDFRHQIREAMERRRNAEQQQADEPRAR